MRKLFSKNTSNDDQIPTAHITLVKHFFTDQNQSSNLRKRTSIDREVFVQKDKFPSYDFLKHFHSFNIITGLGWYVILSMKMLRE